jgi:N-acetylglutamate synthase-like GNAT family acetyltransferase
MVETINLKDEPEHLATLARWHHHEWSFLNPGETLKDRMLRMQPYLNTDFIPSTFIAKDKSLLGSAAIVMNDMDTRPQLTPWLASVFVTPENRRHGIGSKLVSHVMTQARHQGIDTLYLFTPDKQNFYAKLGWTIKSIEQYQGYEVSIMQTRLDKF